MAGIPDYNRHGCHHGPVQTSAVYLCGSTQFPAEPPPSPPSPTLSDPGGGPGGGDPLLCPPIEELSLDAASPPPLSPLSPLPPPVMISAAALSPASPTVTAPPSRVPSPRPMPWATTASEGKDGATPCTKEEEEGRDAAVPRTVPALVPQPPPPSSLAADRLAGAVHVLNTEAAALAALARLYSTDPGARSAFDRAVAIITRHVDRRDFSPPCHSPHYTTTPSSSPPPYPSASTTTTTTTTFLPPPRIAPPPQATAAATTTPTTTTTTTRGTLIITGVGKSGHIARKLVATFNSLSVRAAFLHPTEALHGDLGVLHPDLDAVLLVSFSGRTPELKALVPHLDVRLPVVVLTSTSAYCRRNGDDNDESHRAFFSPSSSSSSSPISPSPSPLAPGREEDREGMEEEEEEHCELVKIRRRMLRESASRGGNAAGDKATGAASIGEIVVLPAPIPVSEVECFGVAAPTSSTTAALALGDALAVVAARELHGGSEGRMAAAFGRNHPGGAIGAAAAAAAAFKEGGGGGGRRGV